MEDRRENAHCEYLPFFGAQSLAAEIHSHVLAKLANERQIESLATTIASDIF